MILNPFTDGPFLDFLLNGLFSRTNNNIYVGVDCCKILTISYIGHCYQFSNNNDSKFV